MKKPTISFYMSAAYPLFAKTDHAFGGAEINLYYISREFSARGYDVEFLVADYGQNDIEIYEGVRVKKIRYFDLDRFKQPWHKVLRRFYFLSLLWRCKSDVFIISAASEMVGYVVSIAKLKKIKTIFRIAHDWDVDASFTQRRDLTGFMYRYALPRFDVIVSQTEDQQRMLFENEGLASGVIRNGFPIAPLPEGLTRSFVLWVGRDDVVKRPLLFLELARCLPDVQFVMIMQGSGALKSKVREEAELIPNLTLIDHVSFFEVQDYFNRALCFVNTSEQEGFPNTFIQACLAATPILSFKVNPGNIINDYKMGMVCDDVTGEAASFISQLDPKSVQTYGDRANAYVREKHNLSDKVDEYESLINELVPCVV